MSDENENAAGAGPETERAAGPVGPLEEVYDREIAPLIQQIKRHCKAAGIDYVMHFALDADPERSGYRGAGTCYVTRPETDGLHLAQRVLRGQVKALLEVDLDQITEMGPGHKHVGLFGMGRSMAFPADVLDALSSEGTVPAPPETLQ